MKFRGLRYPRTARGWWVTGAIFAAVILSPLFWFVHYTSSSPTICQECHSDVAFLWRGSKIHPTSVHCVQCHKSKISSSRSPTMNAADEAINSNCIRCHRDIQDQVFAKQPTKPIRMSHRYHLMEGLVCTDCHRNITHDRNRPGTNRPLKVRCFTCHIREMRWGGWRGTCFRCHYVDFTMKISW
ncbi:MAG: hypothetical protein DRG50_07445 [Deltaproteobacteria bacterium]|nr:MAG: hypothetical protein DRG50_07445 [Deltaproteobacteria bacterium]